MLKEERLMFKSLMLKHLYNSNELRCPYLNVKNTSRLNEKNEQIK